MHRQFLIISCDIELNPGPVSNKLGICHVNIQSMKRNHQKFDQIALQLADNFDVITVSETWLTTAIPDNLFSLPGFHPIHRRHRPLDAAGGGVAAWVSLDLVVRRRYDLEVRHAEALWLELRSHNNVFLLCVVYRPPSTGVSFWENMQFMVDNARSVDRSKHIMFVGDFNADLRSYDGTKFSHFVNDNHFISHINDPTRITNSTQTCLDRIVSNMNQYVISTDILAPLLLNDHCTVAIFLNFNVKRSRCYNRLMWNYARGDYDGLVHYLSSVDWDNKCDNFSDIDIAANAWSETIIHAAKSFIPNRIVTVRKHDKPWYNNDLRRLRRKVERIHRRAKRSNNNTQAWADFRKLRNQYVQQCRNAEVNHTRLENAKLSNCNFTSKESWRIFKSALGLGSANPCPPLIFNGCTTNDDASKANIFNTIFLNKSILDDSNKPLPDETVVLPTDHPVLSDINITVREVSEQLSLLDTSKACGPDGIGPRLLKSIAPAIVDPMCRLFKASLDQRTVPSGWKQANVIPIHKKGDMSDPNNYRPVSLLNTIAKLLEKIIFKHLFNHLRDCHAGNQGLSRDPLLSLNLWRLFTNSVNVSTKAKRFVSSFSI